MQPSHNQKQTVKQMWESHTKTCNTECNAANFNERHIMPMPYNHSHTGVFCTNQDEHGSKLNSYPQ